MEHLFLVLSVFLACSVEMVEALTIILAIGTAREWRSTFYGALAATLALAALVTVFGSTLQLVPQKWLWLIMGNLLLLFGMQWLRNAVLRYSGLKPFHDEAATFTKVSSAAKQKRKHPKNIDWYAFTVVFKGVFLEGLEVVFIVLSFGSSQGSIGLGTIAALAAFVAVSLLGIVIHRPLAKIPENTMKFIVGLVLTTFGTYFGGMGLSINWPHGQMAFADLLIFYVVVAGLAILMLKQSRPEAA